MFAKLSLMIALAAVPNLAMAQGIGGPSATGTATITLPTTSPGTSSPQLLGVQGAPGGVPFQTAQVPVAVSAPDASTVTTANTAVTAFAATHVTKGGWLHNPAAAAGPLCIAVGATATTIDSAATTCLAAGGVYTIAPTAQAVSANAADAGHTFSGAGYQ